MPSTLISVTRLLEHLSSGKLKISFSDVLASINDYYQFTPCAFSNGAHRNEAGQNNGSCQCFYFADLHALTPQQTLLLFCEHYQAVLNTPLGNDHQNIRQFMQHGWQGVLFEGVALVAKKPL